MDWNNKDVVLEAVKKDGMALYYASDRLKDDKEVVLEAIKQDGLALQFASDDLKNDKEVVLEAVKQNGYSLQYASDSLKDDKDVVLAAIKKNREALCLVSNELQSDKDVLNSMRDFLFSDRWIKGFWHDVFFNAKEKLLKYDREDRLRLKLKSSNKEETKQRRKI